MRTAALILALATSASAFMAPRAAVAPRVAPVNMDASSLVTAYRELYEVGGVGGCDFCGLVRLSTYQLEVNLAKIQPRSSRCALVNS